MGQFEISVVVQFEKCVGVADRTDLWQHGDMPKDRKETYSDRQSQATRAKKQQPKKKTTREDASQAAARVVKEATKG